MWEGTGDQIRGSCRALPSIAVATGDTEAAQQGVPAEGLRVGWGGDQCLGVSPIAKPSELASQAAFAFSSAATCLCDFRALRHLRGSYHAT